MPSGRIEPIGVPYLHVVLTVIHREDDAFVGKQGNMDADKPAFRHDVGMRGMNLSWVKPPYPYTGHISLGIERQQLVSQWLEQLVPTQPSAISKIVPFFMGNGRQPIDIFLDLYPTENVDCAIESILGNRP
jgi:hypothetical protein